MSGTKKLEAERITVGPGRLSWPALIEPEETDGGLRYRATLLLPPGSKAGAEVLRVCNDICKQAWGPDPKKWPSNARKPDAVLRRAEEKPDYQGYDPGWTFFSCTSSERPGLVNASLEPVTDPAQVYAGRWAKLSVRPFIYTKKGLGVSLGLSNVQLLKHDSVFGRTSPNQDFDVEAEEVGIEF